MGDLGSIPGLERSPGEGKSYPLQYSGLENSTDYAVRGIAESQTRLSNFHFHFSNEHKEKKSSHKIWADPTEEEKLPKEA